MPRGAYANITAAIKNMHITGKEKIRCASCDRELGGMLKLVCWAVDMWLWIEPSDDGRAILPEVLPSNSG